MNAKTQLDFHPDAESLNAFAERALAEGERGQIAAHLAICGRCRDVVFLAQAAATGEGQLAGALTERNEKRSASWFRNWWLVWAPVAALATIVGLAFSVHLRHAAGDQEMAKATQEVSPVGGPQNQAVPPQPAERPDAVAGAAVPGTAVRKPEMKKSIAQAPPPPGPVKPMLPAPGTVTELAMQSATAESRQAERTTQTEEPANASAEEKGARGQGEMHGTMQTAAAAAPAVNAGAAPIAGFGAMANKTSTRALSLYAALLPSGLPAISKATGSKVTVAMDKAGSVFVNADAGSPWESVARQWSGKAVAVRMQSRTPDVYELVNDQGQMWESTDGKLWTAK